MQEKSKVIFAERRLGVFDGKIGQNEEKERGERKNQWYKLPKI
jgi:hypothetical protein